MPNPLRFLFSFEGRVSRAPYLIAGADLLALKYLLDHHIAASFGQPWHIWSYFFPPPGIRIAQSDHRRSKPKSNVRKILRK